MKIDWPVAEIDTVARLRALAAALPHTLLRECVLDAPVERVWRIVGDLEAGVPRFEGAVRELEIVRRQGEHLELVSTSPLGLRMRFDAVLRPGWCVMRSRAGDVGMAVAPEGDGSRTRFAHFEGSRFLSQLARPLLRRNIEGDFERLAGLLRRGGG
jgi:hypothetical protein